MSVLYQADAILQELAFKKKHFIFLRLDRLSVQKSSST